MLRWPFWLNYSSPSYLAKIFAQPKKADVLEHNISLFSHKMALTNQKAGALEMLLQIEKRSSPLNFPGLQWPKSRLPNGWNSDLRICFLLPQFQRSSSLCYGHGYN